jgi:hypothetical protein
MSAPVHIVDGGGTGTQAKVTTRGQLVSAPIEYDEVYNQSVVVANTAYNLIEPVDGKRFVITVILFLAKKTVTTDVVIELYETENNTSITVTKSIIEQELLKNASRNLFGLNLITSKGAYISVKADDAEVLCTLMGYYVDV